MVITDGQKKKNLNIKKSYNEGVKNLIKISSACFFKHNIDYVSAFALSSHNLLRSKKFVSTIIKILESYLDEFLINRSKYHFNIIFIGDLTIFNKKIKVKMEEINNNNSYNKNLIIALNYSGTKDILNAVLKLKNTKNSDLNLNNYLSTSIYPNPDILIRTGGFQRLSDFFLYQLSFTEFFFSKTLWPDFKISSLNSIIDKFSKIEKKFGK